jgi:hypothetical protein
MYEVLSVRGILHGSMLEEARFRPPAPSRTVRESAGPESGLLHMTDEGLLECIRWLKHQYSFFQEVRFGISPDPKMRGASVFHPKRTEDVATVVLMQGGAEAYEAMRRERPEAIAMIADMLGMDAERMDGNTMRQFMLLHEAGHLFDVYTNYEMESPGRNRTEVMELFEQESDAQMETLPIPGYDPSALRHTLREQGGLDAWRRHDASVDAACREYRVHSEEDLLRVQERAYRSLEKEAFADRFAAQALREIQGRNIEHRRSQRNA